MPTVTGKLEGPINDSIVKGSVEVQLCGYGFQVPRFQGTALFARLTTLPAEIPVAADGRFTFDVTGNDDIAPAGTYYTVTIKDENGDVAQINAYLFLSTGSGYDLTIIPPFDPTQPPPPLPPLIISQLLLIAFSANPDFPGDLYTAWGFTLRGDVAASTLSGIVAGNLYTFIISQDATGGWKFTWPPGVINAGPINPTSNGLTIQTFVALADGGPMLPIAGGTWY